ncbi:hypothetical protein [Catenuloplanes japonicus]|uniref:hypothetical protein n=1 Tax=Catenuloplanes japonicus TaxID=33876 RepID=UPI000524CEAE|nr:hypothetical protein [Catenuloplanes japonicus]
MPSMWWWAGIAVSVMLFVLYLIWTERRVERLHARAESAAAALDAHLLRRAAAAAVLAEQLDVVELYAAARIALDAGSSLVKHGDPLSSDADFGLGADSGEREAAENDLTRQLRRLPQTAGLPEAGPVIAASRRVALARQVFTDSVRDALINRDRPLVRLLGMARGHDRPRYFDIDEPTLTPSLTEPPRQITPQDTQTPHAIS